MSHEVIRVSRISDGTWSVAGRFPLASVKDFRVKSHAIAYARALSWSRHSILMVDDELGIPVRQSRASLTYPVRLD
jgi:hypothetical protein